MNFQLRPFSIEDLDSLVKFANNYNIAKNLTDAFPHPYTIEDGKAFIEMATQNSPRNILAIDINREAAGAIGVHPQKDIYRENLELGYWLAQPYWRKGIMTKAVVQMTDYAFKNFDADRIYARPFGYNIASQRVFGESRLYFGGEVGKNHFQKWWVC